MPRRPPKTDPEIKAHQEWLGFLQPRGLVVAPAALWEALQPLTPVDDDDRSGEGLGMIWPWASASWMTCSWGCSAGMRRPSNGMRGCCRPGRGSCRSWAKRWVPRPWCRAAKVMANPSC
jgi:hypothetical protein